jgi:hypothetical protein
MKRTKKKPVETKFIYRCRMCDMEYENGSCIPGHEHQALINSIYSAPAEFKVPMVGVHACAGFKGILFGVSDLIGCQTV